MNSAIIKIPRGNEHNEPPKGTSQNSIPDPAFFWVWAWADSGGDDSAHIGLGDQAVSSADKIYPNTLGAWVWTKLTMDGPVATLNVAAPGVHVVNIWAREDGMYIDKTLLTRNALYTPSGTGPAESVRGIVNNS